MTAGFVNTVGAQAPVTLPSPAPQALAAALYFATYGVLTTAWATLGEELGWRGRAALPPAAGLHG